MTYPRYDFSDVNLNYNTVNTTVNDMYSDLLSSGGCCCGNKKTDGILDQADLLMKGIEIDFNNGDDARYKSGVKSAYLILFNYVSE